MWGWLHIDDPVEYLTMNVVGGLLGLISVGLFASPRVVHQYGAMPIPQAGVFYGGGAQLGAELIGAGAIIAFAFALAAAASLVLRTLGWLHVSAGEEAEGADKETHGEKAEGSDKDDSGNGGGEGGGGEDEREPQP